MKNKRALGWLVAVTLVPIGLLLAGDPQWHWSVYHVQGHLLGDGSIDPPEGFTGSWIDYDRAGEVVRQRNFVDGRSHGYQADLREPARADYHVCVNGKMLGPTLIMEQHDRQYGIALVNDGPFSESHAVHFSRAQMMGELDRMVVTAPLEDLEALADIYLRDPPWYLDPLESHRVREVIASELKDPRPRPHWFKVKRLLVDGTRLHGEFRGDLSVLEPTPGEHSVLMTIGEQGGRRMVALQAGPSGEGRGIELMTSLFFDGDELIAGYQWIGLAALYRPGARVLLQWRSPASKYDRIAVLRQHILFDDELEDEARRKLSAEFTHLGGGYRGFRYDVDRRLRELGLPAGGMKVELSVVEGYAIPEVR